MVPIKDYPATSKFCGVGTYLELKEFSVATTAPYDLLRTHCRVSVKREADVGRRVTEHMQERSQSYVCAMED